MTPQARTWNATACYGSWTACKKQEMLLITRAQAVAPTEKEEERDEDDEFGGHGGINGPGTWMR